MNLLADEHIDAIVIAWLRDTGHDVLSVRETVPGASDFALTTIAYDESRAILTEDKDFGELVFRLGRPIPGLLLLRYQVRSRQEHIETFKYQWPSIAGRLSGKFIVATTRSIRVRAL